MQQETGKGSYGTPRWLIDRGDSPIVAPAIHDGHFIRGALLPYLALSDEARLREEDPHTGSWTGIAPTRIVGLRSRFEVDLNRPQEKAVYLEPQDSWGLKVWNETLPDKIVKKSISDYVEFYAQVENILQHLVEQYERVIVYDLHTYNHRRRGPYADPAEPLENPQVNLGTGTMDRVAWAPVVDRFLQDLREYDFPGRKLDVRENIKFFGGQLPKWIHHRFPGQVCVLSIEFKKFFMDEWTGEVNKAICGAISDALKSTVPGLLTVLEEWPV